jgi:hypothetical protein
VSSLPAAEAELACRSEGEVVMLSRLPVKSPPVVRGLVTNQGHQTSENATGVQAAQTGCEGLTGLAQQMCYSVLYGV